MQPWEQPNMAGLLRRLCGVGSRVGPSGRPQPATDAAAHVASAGSWLWSDRLQSNVCFLGQPFRFQVLPSEYTINVLGVQCVTGIKKLLARSVLVGIMAATCGVVTPDVSRGVVRNCRCENMDHNTMLMHLNPPTQHTALQTLQTLVTNMGARGWIEHQHKSATAAGYL